MLRCDSQILESGHSPAPRTQAASPALGEVGQPLNHRLSSCWCRHFILLAGRFSHATPSPSRRPEETTICTWSSLRRAITNECSGYPESSVNDCPIADQPAPRSQYITRPPHRQRPADLQPDRCVLSLYRARANTHHYCPDSSPYDFRNCGSSPRNRTSSACVASNNSALSTVCMV